ncbi:addiction module protein [Synechococcus elongatus]
MGKSMLTLEQLISEATALPDSDKEILLDKILESISGTVDYDALRQGVKLAQDRLAEIDNGTVQTISGEAALAQIRQMFAQ